MIETTNNTSTCSQVIHGGLSECPRDYYNERRARADYYRAYYRALVEEHASRGEKQRGGLDSIKMRRRRERRAKWLQGMRSLVVGVLNKSEASS
jgi:hypothetical protein